MMHFRKLAVACVAVLGVAMLTAGSAFAARTYESRQITEAKVGEKFSSISGLAVDSSDNVWVNDAQASKVSKFNSSGVFQAQNDGTAWSGSTFIGGLAYGKTAGLVYVPDSNADDLWGLNQADATYASVDLKNGLGAGCCFIRAAVDNSGGAHDGDIYVSGNGNTITRVDGSSAAVNFSASQSYISNNQITGTPAHSFGGVGSGADLAVDASGNVYFVDASNGEVDEFDPTGTFVRAFTGTFGSITSVAVDPTSGDVLIGDAPNHVVHEFTSTGTFVGDTDGSATPEGSFNPVSLAVDSTGKLYVGNGDAAHPVVDVFSANSAPLSKFAVTVTNGGGGEVTSTPAGIACGATCSEEFEETKKVVLSATAEAGHKFVEWTGEECAGSTSTTCEFTMPAQAVAVTATFAAAGTQYPLTVVKYGLGTVESSSPLGISCGLTCTALFEEGAVTLSETPETGYEFAGWIGCKSTGASTCEVSVTKETEVSAVFLRAGSEGPAGPAGKDGTNGTNGTNGAAGNDGAAGANGKDGAQGPAGANGKDGAAGPAGPAGAAGPAGPAGKVELVTCKTAKKKGKKVQKCTTKLVSGTVKFTASGASATLSRNGVVYAAGTASRVRGHMSLRLAPLRKLRHGHYRLTLVSGSGSKETIHSEAFTLS